LALAALLAAASACSSATDTAKPATTTEQDTAAIARGRDAYVAGWKAGNATDIASGYTSDALAFPANQPTVTGRDAITKFNDDFFRQFTPDDIKLTPEETKVMGDWAFDRGTYHVVATPKVGGDHVTEDGRYLVLLQRQADGSWKMARDIDNTIKPTPAPEAAPAP
jgi:uncharacterized protein (TIGR02246 family)